MIGDVFKNIKHTYILDDLSKATGMAMCTKADISNFIEQGYVELQEDHDIIMDSKHHQLLVLDKNEDKILGCYPLNMITPYLKFCDNVLMGGYSLLFKKDAPLIILYKGDAENDINLQLIFLCAPRIELGGKSPMIGRA